MSSSQAASLSASLLVTKRHAQPSRGLAEPMSDRVAFSGFDAPPPPPVVRPVVSPHPAEATTAPHRISFHVEDEQLHRLRLAAAHLAKSRQAILVDALEHYLTRILPAYLHDRCPCVEGDAQLEPNCCARAESR